MKRYIQFFTLLFTIGLNLPISAMSPETRLGIAKFLQKPKTKYIAGTVIALASIIFGAWVYRKTKQRKPEKPEFIYVNNFDEAKNHISAHDNKAKLPYYVISELTHDGGHDTITFRTIDSKDIQDGTIDETNYKQNTDSKYKQNVDSKNAIVIMDRDNFKKYCSFYNLKNVEALVNDLPNSAKKIFKAFSLHPLITITFLVYKDDSSLQCIPTIDYELFMIFGQNVSVQSCVEKITTDNKKINYLVPVGIGTESIEYLKSIRTTFKEKNINNVTHIFSDTISHSIHEMETTRPINQFDNWVNLPVRELNMLNTSYIDQNNLYKVIDQSLVASMLLIEHCQYLLKYLVNPQFYVSSSYLLTLRNNGAGDLFEYVTNDRKSNDNSLQRKIQKNTKKLFFDFRLASKIIQN